MKRQASNQQTTKTNISLYLLGLLMLLFSLLSCSDPFAGIGSGDDSCKLDPSLFDGQYLVSDLCSTNWGSSDKYIITMTLNQDPNVIGCAWNIQNLLGNKTIIHAWVFSSSRTELRISDAYMGPDVIWWIKHGTLYKNDNEITIDATLGNYSSDSTFTCMITGTKL